jgi:hypothetical protein
MTEKKPVDIDRNNHLSLLDGEVSNGFNELRALRLSGFVSSMSQHYSDGRCGLNAEFVVLAVT